MFALTHIKINPVQSDTKRVFEVFTKNKTIKQFCLSFTGFTNSWKNSDPIFKELSDILQENYSLEQVEIGIFVRFL